MINPVTHPTIVEGILIEGLTQLTFNCKKYRNKIVVLVFTDSTKTTVEEKLFGHHSTIPDDIASSVTFLVINIDNTQNACVVECFKVTSSPTFVINKTVYNPGNNTHEFRRITTLETQNISDVTQAIRDQC